MKRALIIILVLAVVGGATWFLYDRANREPAETVTAEGYTTQPAFVTSLDAGVTVTGNVVAERNQTVSFASSGTIVAVHVQQGDRVTKGQVLAELDTADLELAVTQAEATLAIQEANLARALTPATEEDIAAAEAAVASAEAQLADLQKGPSARDIEAARISVEQAKASLWGAQGSRDATVGNPMAGGGSKAQAEAAVSQAEWAVKQAELNQQRLWEKPSASSIAAAEAQIANTKASLARLLQGASDQEIAVLEAQIAQARISVESARSRLDDAILTAPADGVLATWNLRPGDLVSPAAPIGSLVDDSAYYVEVAIDETEIAQVQEGQQATISLDAFPEQELTGTVDRISLLGTSVQGLVNYTVRIAFDHDGLPVRPLMTGVISVVTQQRQDALVVPNRALRRDARGIFVEQLRGGMPVRVDVTTGIANDSNTEILSGLSEGDQVIVARPRGSLLESLGVPQ